MNKLPFIQRGHTGSMDFQRKNSNFSPYFLGIYMIGVFIFFVVVVIRLFHLTVVKGAYYSTLSDNNRVREIIIEPQRGKIIDRKGVILAANHASDETKRADRLVSSRIYYKPDSTGHILGYRQTADKNDLKNDPCINHLKLGDKTGKKGVEKLYECQLRGEHGKKLIEVDAMGRYVKTLSVLEPIPGQDVELGLDSMLQEKAQELLKGQKGAVVGLKPSTGEVLVLASNPTFNPQVFEDSDSKEVSKLFTDEDKPMFNRATEGAYPPGSTFKMFVAAAGLEEKAVTADTIFQDDGVLKAGQKNFHNWYYLEYGKTEGEVNLLKSLQRSNDTYYYQLGAKLGPEKIKKWAEIFGFHSRTGIGIDEVEGIVPSSFWKQDTYKEQWYTGDTYNFSIGQGYVTATPLQVSLATVPFANDGKYCRPMLLKKNSTDAAIPHCEKLPMSKETYEVIREGMKLACQTGGTAWPFFNFGVKESTPSASNIASASAGIKRSISVGCKTGTAESHNAEGKPHAWFTVFAPYENPEIVLTVIVEESGQGSDVAAPIAKDILQMYFERLQ
ncbi:penicillin-binding protein 2 [soil metagenome]